MIDITQLLGQPAVSLVESERTGTVKGLRFEGNRIVSVDIGDGRTIPADAVKTFEGDALTYNGETVELSKRGAVDATSDQADANDGSDAQGNTAELGMLAGELPLPVAAVRPGWGNPIGTLLLSDTGEELGILTAMHINADGVIAEIVGDRGQTHTGDRVLTVGSFATIVTADDTRPDR